MKLALDATYALDRNPSGVAVYSREILDGTAAAHPEARFLFCYRPHRFLRSFESPVPVNCSRRLLHEPLVPRSADLFHGLNQRLPDAPLRRTVATFHDLFVITGDYSTPEFRRRFERQAKEAAARADLLIAVSDFTARQVQSCFGIAPDRLRVIHHGVRLPRLAPPDASARERIVLHVGAIQKRKNILRLVRAFEQMSAEWRLVLAGSHGYGSAEILQTIDASPARDRISALGYTPEAELRRWYARAAIFAFPSLDEGFGMPVLEAMAWNVPVLTSDRSALPEVSGDAAILVNPEDVDALASKLKELGENQELREKLQERGRRRVENFTWPAAVSKTWAVYSELLSMR